MAFLAVILQFFRRGRWRRRLHGSPPRLSRQRDLGRHPRRAVRAQPGAVDQPQDQLQNVLAILLPLKSLSQRKSRRIFESLIEKSSFADISNPFIIFPPAPHWTEDYS